MNNEVKNKVLGLLNYKAPNWVSELIFNAHDIPADENFQRTIEKLEGDGLIEKQIDLRTRIEKPMNYYRIKLTKNLAIRDYIKIGDTKIPRLLSESGPRFLPEDFNESVERLAIYADEVEHRIENRMKNQLKDYWAKTITVFTILAALLAIILGNAPTLNTSQFYDQGFWYSLGQNFAVLIPFCLILIIFALLMWFIITRK